MLALGIDPGTAILGYGLVKSTGNRLSMVDYGCIRSSPRDGLAERLAGLYDAVRDVIEARRPEVVAVEELFFNRNAKTALAVGQARGVVLLAAAHAGVPVAEYTPLEVKMAVTGYGRAEKEQVQAMVRILLGLAEVPRPDDAADALAVAICCLHSRSTVASVLGAEKGE